MKLFDRRKISRNVAATLIQVIVTGVVFFLLYRFLYHQLGIAQVGVWSIVLATTSVSRIGDLGLSAAVVRYVSKALANDDHAGAAQVIDTVGITLALSMALLLAAGLPAFRLALEFLVPSPSTDIAKSVLPYALVSFWSMTIASAFLGGLDGCQRIDLRAGLTALSHIAYLGLAVVWTPKYGLKGVAFAQITQTLGLALAARLVLLGQLKSLDFFPKQWRLLIFRQLLRYGLNLQVISLMGVLFDPLTKGLLAKFGGLAALGYYEMVNKLILQARSAVVEAIRVLVPVVSTLKERSPGQVNELFLVSYRTVFFVSTLFYACIGALMPSISLLWIGEFQPTLVGFGLLLALGWFANTLVVPAYFSNLGSGELKDNVIGQVIIGVVSLSAGTVFGILIGGKGVVVGAVLGLVGGSGYVLASYIERAALDWSSIVVPRRASWLLLACAAAVGVSNVYAYAKHILSLEVIAIGLICAGAVAIFGWFHPLRRDLFRWPNRFRPETTE